MTRTTILLENDLLLRVKHLAHTQGTTFTAILREALNAYLSENHPPQRRLSFTAVGKGKLPNVAENAEAIIKRSLNHKEGFKDGHSR